MMTENWINMDANATQQARQRKAYNIRLCRHYLHRALSVMGLSEKSTTVKKYRYMLAEARARTRLANR